MKKCKFCGDRMWPWQSQMVDAHERCNSIDLKACENTWRKFTLLTMQYGYPTPDEMLIGYKIVDNMKCFLIKVDDNRMYSKPGE